MTKIPFNKPYMTGREMDYIQEAYDAGHLASNGLFTKRCQKFIEEEIGCKQALLTHSATGALEACAILADIQSGDEIIMPSYTFVTTALAFVLRGGVPVFVDIREDTLNIDETKIEDAITKKTKAIVVVHYAGVGCEMDAITHIARKHKLFLIEDAAHGFLGTYKDKPLGSFGDLSVLSFHETKNIISGEGGALLVNNPELVVRSKIVLEKGTNRNQFEQGLVEKYTWVDLGSSLQPSELVAAFLYAQLEEAEMITEQRLELWCRYHEVFSGQKDFRTPIIPKNTIHNAHMYYLILPTEESRNHLLHDLQDQEIGTVFHYIPLHESDAGKTYARPAHALPVTETMARRIVRLPLWIGLGREQERVIEAVEECLVQSGHSV